MYLFYLHLLILNALVWITQQRSCTEKDIGKIITDCNLNKEREVYFYWKKDCNQNSSIKLPGTKIISGCDKICSEGELMDYSLNQNKLICTDCPIGTYAKAGSKSIKQWNENVLKQFVNNCYVIVGDDMKTNNQCDKFRINKKAEVTSIIAGGNKKNKDAMYSYELVFNGHVERPGKIKFTYRKDTFIDSKYVNGQFNFYIDYDLKYHDVDTNKNQQSLEFKLEKGYHSFMWKYDVWADLKENKNMTFEIFSIEVEGFKDDYLGNKCIPCDQNSSAYDTCKKCPENKYFDQEKKKCEECADDEYIFGPGNNKADCIKRPVCNQDDIYEEHKGICDENDEEEVVFHFDNKFCLPNDSITTLPANKKEKCDCPIGMKLINSMCESCPGNFSLDTKTNMCVECPKGADITKLLTITGHTKDARSLFNNNICYTYSFKTSRMEENKSCTGWVFRSDGIYSGLKVINRSWKVLTKTVQVDKTSASLSIDVTINELSNEHNESFIVKINEVEDKYSQIPKNSEKKNLKKQYTLNQGYNEIEFIFIKDRELNSNSLTEEVPAVIINKITIEGSNEGAGIQCSDCTVDSLKIKKDGKTICKPCEKGFIPNDKRDTCRKCTKEDSFNVNCRNCPLHTETTNYLYCNLNTILHEKRAGLKFDLKDINNQLVSGCKGTENELCYNTFLGPIRDPKENNLFYLSYSQSNEIAIKDFSFNITDGYLPKGHIFSLFHLDSSYQQNTHVDNTKMLKNIGSHIQTVEMISQPNNHLKRELESKNLTNIFNNTGLMIKYTDGEHCKESERFRSYLFLYCSKSRKDHSPRLTKKSENGCAFFFEMYSYEACPFCVKNQTDKITTSCINERHSIIYEENDSCRIGNEYVKESNMEISKNEISTIMNFTYVVTNPDLSYYFNIDTKNKNYYKGDTYTKLPEDNLDLIDESIYLQQGRKFVEECSLMENLDGSVIYLIFVVPLIYFSAGFCVIVFYCRYRKMRNEYERLREEKTLENSVDNTINAISQEIDHNDNKLQIDTTNVI